MAKIDTSKITGYDTMTAEEKLAALEALEIEEPDMSGFVKKDIADKYASEAANYKKQLRERMNDDEVAKAKAAEDMATVMAELETLRAEKSISEYTAQFMGIGQDEALAKTTAKALHEGDMTTLFKNHGKFVSDREKALKTELLKTTPTPPAGDGNKGVTREDFSKMSLADKAKFANENPDKYKEFYGGN